MNSVMCLEWLQTRGDEPTLTGLPRNSIIASWRMVGPGWSENPQGMGPSWSHPLSQPMASEWTARLLSKLSGRPLAVSVFWLCLETQVLDSPSATDLSPLKLALAAYPLPTGALARPRPGCASPPIWFDRSQYPPSDVLEVMGR